MYSQDYCPTDQAHLPEELQTRGITILKAHHSLCDGVSAFCMVLSMSPDYSRDYFIKSQDAKWYEQLFVKLTCFTSLPFLFWNFILSRVDHNYITKGKEG